ncbi:MAG TPA: efflux RND transporter permease subunit [Sedimentisphaerales bacterium]|jgi:HAE1 family hydrophobic/amphiphilic exporter-1|nr:efflux RND transporter permease subunit [Sedimentisphaerales bacterium]HNU29923.1 efflux RND transporter permease subunit [Sedimentisphaerales bacterium]
MFLSDSSIRRPVAMTSLIIGLTLLGLNAYRKLGLELMPKMDVPYITVTTIYPGASPEQIETDVAKRIEDQVVTIDGLKHVSSACMENVCQTLLEFELDVDVDIAATDVREKLDLIRADFPEDVEDPKILKFDINAQPIVHMALTGDVPLDELFDYADNTLRDRITVISGVANVELVGGAKREVHVLLDREELAAKGLSSLNVVQAIQQAVRTIPSGRVTDHGRELSVKFNAEYKEVPEIGTLEVANEAGRRCYIRDVGRVVMTTEELRQKAAVDGRPCVYIKVVKKAEANAVKVVNSVKDAAAKLNEQLPGGMELVWVTDDGRFIEASVRSAWSNVGQGILLTAAILFFFLYNVRATLVVGITMPLTIVIGLFFMQLAGYTLNTSTLISIGLSVGILVTNSIVVLESIVSRLKATGDPKEASRLGAKEVTVAVLASAGTNIVVLFPIAMMGSIIGQFMKPLAWTMLIMTAVSLFISFTLTPILCSILLKPANGPQKGILHRMEAGFDRILNRVIAGYRAILSFNEKHRIAAIAILLLTVALFVHAMSLGGRVGFGFAPTTDQARVFVKLEYPTSYSLDRSIERVRLVEKRLQDVPELRHVLSSIGKVEGVIGQSTQGVYLAQLLLTFSERDERTLTIEDLQAEIRKRLEDYPECIITVTQPALIGGQNQDIELLIAGNELATLNRLALDTQNRAGRIPGIKDMDTTVREGKPEMAILPKRAVLADLNIPATSLGMVLRANLEGIEAGTFKRGDRNYDIVVELADEPGQDQVGRFLFPGTPGQPILLSNLADMEHRVAPVQITRQDKQRVTKVFANLKPELALGNAVKRITETIDSEGHFPPGYDYWFSGMYERMAEAVAAFGEAGLTAIVLVILSLAAILESYKQPWLILVTVPLGLIGVMWALAMTGESMSLFVLMGMVMMVGIVVNNAILIVDAMNVHVREGTPRHKAMIAAACEQFRPVVMITLAAVLGMLPLATSRGIGAELRTGVGIASVGGILVSGLLTLILLPILYDLFTRKGTKH